MVKNPRTFRASDLASDSSCSNTVSITTTTDGYSLAISLAAAGPSGKLAQSHASVLGDGNHVDAVLAVQQACEPLTDDHVVVGKQDADWFTHQQPLPLGFSDPVWTR